MQGQVAASTQNQAFSALLFLFREVLKRDLAGLEQVVRAKRSVHVPQVLSRSEVTTILGHLRGTPGSWHLSCTGAAFACWSAADCA